MCTAALQDSMPDFISDPLKDTSVTFPGDKNYTGPTRRDKNGIDVPLGSIDPETKSILQRRDRIKQAQENPGSHIPSGIRTRLDIMRELT